MPFLVGKQTVATLMEVLTMDGRRRAVPVQVFDQLWEHAFSIAMVRETIENFLANGYSGPHSGNRHTLPFVLAYCEENAIPYTLTAAFTREGKRAGYSLKREDPL